MPARVFTEGLPRTVGRKRARARTLQYDKYFKLITSKTKTYKFKRKKECSRGLALRLIQVRSDLAGAVRSVKKSVQIYFPWTVVT